MQTDCAHNSARTVFNREKIFSRQNAYIFGARRAELTPPTPLWRTAGAGGAGLEK